MDGPEENTLDAVYAARGVEEIARLYDGWAATYEAQMASVGYRHPSICLALVARHLPRGEGPVLDAGAGTGLLGDWLGICGYPEVEALDVSAEMLAVAAAKNVYRRLHRATLGAALPFPDGRFAAVVASGVFTTGHVGPEGLPELIRVTRKGGPIVLTVKSTLWSEGFLAAVGEHEAAGRIALVEATTPYVSMPGEAGTVPSLAVVLKVR